MNRFWMLLTVPLICSVPAEGGRAQKPADAPSAAEVALKLSLAAAAEYEVRAGTDPDDRPLDLVRESRLKWSNPSASDVQGNVFVWTRHGRPLVVGSFMKWFAFVRGTDPELFLVVEARGAGAATARWQFAAARMTNMAELRLRHRDKQVWEAGLLPWAEVSGTHALAYTAFEFKEPPAFLKDAAKPKP
jgi:hypothetical protein